MSKKCTKKCAVCACRHLIFPRSSINVLLFWYLYCCCSCCCYSSLFRSEGVQCHDIWKNPNCINLYTCSETTGYYINVPVFYTYSVSANKNGTFIIEWRHKKSWIFCYLKSQWGYNMVIFSLNQYCILNRLLKIFYSFLFYAI